MRILDIGCGNGDLSRLMASLVGHEGEIVGIDRSEDALALARAVQRDPQHAPIRYQTVDLSCELTDLDNFDAIVGRRVLMYLPDAAGTLTRLARLAKPGTILALQEHARADLPSGAADLPVHRRCYNLAWDTVSAEGGDVHLGYRLADLVRRSGFSIENAWSEGVLIHPWSESFLPTLMRSMLPRMAERGVATELEMDLSSLDERLDEERRTVGGTILWDLAFLVSGRFC